MVLSETGSIAELKPFTKQVISEMKSNVEGLTTNLLQSKAQNKRLWNEVMYYLKDLPVQPGAGSAWTVLGSFVDTKAGQVTYWNYNDIVNPQGTFTW